MKIASNPTESRNIFARRLREIMKKTNTSQQKLAKEVAISRQSIAQYADGTAVPTVERLYKISEYFHVSSDYLIGRIEVPSPNIAIMAIHNNLGLSFKAIQSLRFYKHVNRGEEILSVVNFLLEQQNPMKILNPPTDFDGNLGEYWEFMDCLYEPGLEKWEKGTYAPLLTKIKQYLALKVFNDEEQTITWAGTVTPRGEISMKSNSHWKDLFEMTTVMSSTLVENVLLMEINDMLRELRQKWPIDEEWDGATEEDLPEI